MCDRILFGHPSVSKRQTQSDEKSQINLVTEVIRHTKDEWVPRPQAFFSETLRIPPPQPALW